MQASVKEDRDKYIGGSDIPAIMGISPFKTRFDLLLEKAGLKETDFDGNEYTEYGNIMEPKIREYCNGVFDTTFKEGKHIDGDIRCHTDGEDDKLILEIKTTSQIHETVEEYKVYLVQLLFYIIHTKKEHGALAVYSRPDDFNEEFDENRIQVFLVHIKDYEELIEQINQAVDQFRIDLEKIKDNPLITEEELMPTELVNLSNQIEKIENKLKKFKELTKQEEDLKSALKTSMKKFNVKKWTTNNGTQITLVADGEDKEVKKLNEDKLKEEQPMIYEKYLETKIQKGKAGYVKITL